MTRLSKGAENSISKAFVVMCAVKIRRLLRLFFYHYLCLVMHLEMVRLYLDRVQAHLAA